jgi:D-alanyl-D-alanine carboxypeptidase (penicillin-binding protein 5/6)
MRSLPLIALMGLCLLISAPSFAKMETAAKQVILQDYETGQILFSKNHDQTMPTSSMSKVMTMYMVFDALKRGEITMDTTFKVSKKAWEKGGSKMFVEVNKSVSIQDLVRGVIVQSGNDATIVLAEGLAGSEKKFAREMTRKAKQIGMKNSNFANASGWPDPNHYSTAEDLALLTKTIMKEFPEYYAFYKEKEFEYNKIKQPNRNPLLYRNIGADGVKTGHTEIGGYGLIGSAANDDRRVIMVVNGLGSTKQRADVGSQIIEWGLNGFENKTLYTKGSEVAGARVLLGKLEVVPLILKEDLHVTLPKVGRDDIKATVHYNSPLKAPVRQGPARLQTGSARGVCRLLPRRYGRV